MNQKVQKCKHPHSISENVFFSFINSFWYFIALLNIYATHLGVKITGPLSIIVASEILRLDNRGYRRVSDPYSFDTEQDPAF
jgi:hypothetical protein